jgi:hypothetical protein
VSKKGEERRKFRGELILLVYRKISAANNLPTFSRDGSKNIYVDD